MAWRISGPAAENRCGQTAIGQSNDVAPEVHVGLTVSHLVNPARNAGDTHRSQFRHHPIRAGTKHGQRTCEILLVAIQEVNRVVREKKCLTLPGPTRDPTRLRDRPASAPAMSAIRAASQMHDVEGLVDV